MNCVRKKGDAILVLLGLVRLAWRLFKNVTNGLTLSIEPAVAWLHYKALKPLPEILEIGEGERR